MSDLTCHQQVTLIKMRKKMKRNKENTKQKIIETVGNIIEKKGFDKIGINTVAKEAAVDKVLIYRYFGGINGLLKEYVMQEDLLKKLIEEFNEIDIDDRASFIESASNFYIKQLRSLRNSRKYQEILLWELHEQNDITKKIAEVREQKSLELFEKMENIPLNDKIDIPAINNILMGGIIYQVLRSRHVDQFAGLDYNSDTGWERLESSIIFLIDMVSDMIFNEN